MNQLNTIKNISWNTISTVITQGLQLLSVLVLARYLEPSDFGVFAIIFAIVVFLNMYADAGFSAYLIHKKNIEDAEISAFFYLNLVIGIALTIITYFSAPFISALFENKELQTLLEHVSIIFTLFSLGLVHKSLIEKALNFKSIAIAEITASLVSTIVAITMGLLGFGVIALIVQLVLLFTLRTIAYVILYRHWKPSKSVKWSSIKEGFDYSKNLIGFLTVNYFARNADQFLIGKYLSTEALGYYSIAYRVMLFPVQRISQVIVRVLFPSFSLIREDKRSFQELYLNTVHWISVITFPTMIFIYFFAEQLVSLFLGEKWSDVAGIIKILAPVGAIQSVVTTVGSVFMAVGNTQLMFKLGSVNALVTVIAFITGTIMGSVEAIATFYLVVNIIMFYPNMHFALKQIDLTIGNLIYQLKWVIFVSCLIFWVGAVL